MTSMDKEIIPYGEYFISTTRDTKMAKAIAKEEKEVSIKSLQPYKVEWISASGFVSDIGEVKKGQKFSVPKEISYGRAEVLERQKTIKRIGD